MNNQIKEDMKSILDNRPELVKEVNKVAEVAGYLWQKVPSQYYALSVTE